MKPLKEYINNFYKNNYLVYASSYDLSDWLQKNYKDHILTSGPAYNSIVMFVIPKKDIDKVIKEYNKIANHGTSLNIYEVPIGYKLEKDLRDDLESGKMDSEDFVEITQDLI